MRVPDLLRSRAEVAGARVAHVDDHRALTFAEWDADADDIARGLVAAGVAPSDRVVLAIANAEATVMAAATLAVHRAGAVAVPVNVRWTPRETATYAQHVGARWAITTDPGIVERASLEVSWSTGNLPRRAGAATPTRLDGCTTLDILATSGTTGSPKGVVSRHDQLVAQLAGELGPPRRVVHAMPLTSYGGHHGYLFQPLRDGATVVTMGSFTVAGFVSLVRTHRPDTVTAVPAMLALLARSPELAALDGSSVATIRTGTAPLAPAVARAVSEHFPRANLLNLYGSTEAGAGSGWVLAVHGPGGAPLHRELNAGKAFDIRDADGRPLATGVDGDVWLRVASPRCYWNEPEASAQTWRGHWVHTGDRGTRRDDGGLELIGRGTDMIIRGGFNISPVEIEDHLHDHPAVDEAVVVGVPHDVLGEDLVALVSTAHDVTPAELTSWLADRIAAYKVPRRIDVIADGLPRNAMGKLDRLEARRRVVASTRGAVRA